MAKFSSTLIEEASGKLGKKLVMRNTAKGQILAKAPRKASQPRRSEKQANTRFQMSNLLANYRLYSGKLAEAFENKGAGLSDANMYVSVNWGYQPVYMTRQMRLQGCCVLADNMFSTGSLDPIGYALNDDGKLVSDLDLGFEISASTTVAQLSMALMQRSEGWEEGDQLTCFIGTQYLGSDGLPRATMKAHRVVISLEDSSTLWDVVSADGFSTVGGCLASGVVLENMGCAWVHSRDQNNSTKVSTQRLVVVSDVIAQYQTYAAMKAAADSYGGINKKAVYLNPGSSLIEIGNIVSGGGSTGSGSGGSSQSGGSGSGTTGGQNGGNSGGSDNGSGNSGGTTGGGTTTVNAPTFSGETQFTESTQVTMSGPSGASIFYTVDGSTPTDQSLEYEEPITLSATTTVKAIAIKDGVSSAVTSRTYTKVEAGGGGEDEPGGDDH